MNIQAAHHWARAYKLHLEQAQQYIIADRKRKYTSFKQNQLNCTSVQRMVNIHAAYHWASVSIQATLRTAHQCWEQAWAYKLHTKLAPLYAHQCGEQAWAYKLYAEPARLYISEESKREHTQNKLKCKCVRRTSGSIQASRRTSSTAYQCGEWCTYKLLIIKRAWTYKLHLEQAQLHISAESKREHTNFTQN